MIKAWQNFIKQSIISKNNNTRNTNFDIMEGICNLANYAAIEIKGEDAFKFLQGQITCDIRKANENSFTYGSYCNTKGRVIAFFKLLQWNDSYILTLPLELVELTIKELQKYVLISKVKIADYSENLIQIALHGKEVIDDFINNNQIELIEFNDNGIFKDEFLFAILENKNVKNLKLFVKDFEYAKSILQILMEKYPLLNENFNNLIEIRNKIPEIYNNSIGEFLPHNIELPKIGAVHFNKGCYRGQEIIARMQYKATIKKSLQYLTSEKSITEIEPKILSIKSIDKLNYSDNLSNDNNYSIYNFCHNLVNQEINIIIGNEKKQAGRVVRSAINDDNKIELLAEINNDFLGNSDEFLHFIQLDGNIINLKYSI